MLNFKAFVEATKAEVVKHRGPEAPVCCDMEYWDGGAQQRVQFSIWDGKTHYYGRTPHEALAKLRAAYAPTPPEGPSMSLDELQAVEVPAVPAESDADQ